MTEQIVTQLLSYFVSVVASILASVLIGLCVKYFGKIKMQKIQTLLNTQKGIVNEALKSVEHKFGNVDGQAKFAIASKMISEQCAKFGVKIDEQTIEMLIDSGLKEFKLQFGEQWKNATQVQGEPKLDAKSETNEYVDAVQKATQMSV